MFFILSFRKGSVTVQSGKTLKSLNDELIKYGYLVYGYGETQDITGGALENRKQR